MIVTARDGTVYISGEIANSEGVDALLEQLNVAPTPVRLDSAGLSRGNSRGLFALATALRTRGAPPLRHVNVSLFLALQFSLAPTLLRPEDDIESATFRVVSPSDEVLDVVLRPGLDFPWRTDYVGFNPRFTRDGVTYELEGLAEDVFAIFAVIAARVAGAA
jgi:hypothetical protein